MNVDIDSARLDGINHDLRKPKYVFHHPFDASTESHAPECPAIHALRRAFYVPFRLLR